MSQSRSISFTWLPSFKKKLSDFYCEVLKEKQVNFLEK